MNPSFRPLQMRSVALCETCWSAEDVRNQLFNPRFNIPRRNSFLSFLHLSCPESPLLPQSHGLTAQVWRMGTRWISSLLRYILKISLDKRNLFLQCWRSVTHHLLKAWLCGKIFMVCFLLGRNESLGLLLSLLLMKEKISGKSFF